ncbi:MAG: hypothetical protein JWN48_975, partial [Myxococcaceae bacterium]|nr:hypothetical protein [Myxococcaceae bacterium]
MMRLSPWFFSILLCVLSACAAPVRKQPRQRLPTPVSAVDPDAGVAQAADASTSGPKQELVEVRVLVVAYAGADNARANVTRTKEQALERAQMLARMAKSGDRL